ncbi:hypothetical protein [Paraburkholderia sp.]|uniref:hypothetical protein n=1 Tax=Paraburkholderia sp. TaxID=1926495 RepID=UPI0039E5B06E
MDYETKLVQARLDAIEAVLLNLVGLDGETLAIVRTMLSREHAIARDRQNARDEPRLQTSVQFQMRPARDTGAEAARTDAYERLCRKFGAELSD